MFKTGEHKSGRSQPVRLIFIEVFLLVVDEMMKMFYCLFKMW